MSRPRHILTKAALLALFATQCWAQAGMLRGTVIDADRNPLAGVKITVTSEQLSSFRKTLVTDDDGEFSLRFQKTQAQYRFDFLFEKPGYQSFTQPLSPSAVRQIREEFVMEKSESQVVESLGDLSSVVTGSTSAAIEAFNTGLTEQKAGNLDVALAKYQEAVAADPTLAPAQIALAQVLLDRGEHAAAIDAADRALELSGNRADALRVKHQALRALGRKEEAEAVGAELEQAEDAVTTARRLYNEGGEAFQADDHDTALAKFQRAAELNPSLTEAHHAIATLELAKGNHEASARAAKTALSLGSEDIRTLRVLYDAYEALGRIEELSEIAPRLASVDPDFGGSKLVEQAAALWNAGQVEQAVALSRLALSIDPELAKAYYFLGLDHVSKGKNEEAKVALQKFIDLAPDDPDAATAREMLSYIE
jgi:tetratricopeptide (TPR) repeat protein